MGITITKNPDNLGDNAVQDFEIDLGLGTDQLNAEDIPYDATYNVKSKIEAIEAGAVNSISVDYTAGEALTAGDIVYMKSDGKVYKAQADGTAAEQELYGVAKTSVSADETVSTSLAGIEDSFAGLTTGTVYYLSETAGEITSTAPTTSGSVVVRLGVAETSTSINVRPQIIAIRS